MTGTIVHNHIINTQTTRQLVNSKDVKREEVIGYQQETDQHMVVLDSQTCGDP
jgi:hypothetical protein